jgi:hypothetical protein
MNLVNGFFLCFREFKAILGIYGTLLSDLTYHPHYAQHLNLRQST